MNNTRVKKQRNDSRLRVGRERFDGAGLYLFSALGLLPLVFYDGYFDITETKTLYFVCISAVFLLIRLVLFIQDRTPSTPVSASAVVAAAFPAVFCLVSLMASLSSGFFRESFLGIVGRYQGTGMFLLYALLYYAFPRRKEWDTAVMLPLCFGLLLSAFLAVVNHLGADPLGLSASLGSFDQERYISTLGNINFAGAYLCLTVPVAGRYLLSGRRADERAVLVGAAFIMGVCAAAACRSECTILGIGAALILMPFTIKDDASALRCWGVLLIGVVVTMQLYAFIALRAGSWLSSITDILLRPSVSVPICVFGAVWYLLVGKRCGREKRILRYYGAFLAVCAAGGALLLYLLNTRWQGVSLGAAEDWLRFSDGWGTDRILIWRHCIGFYRAFPVWKKLFGGGCGILARLDVYSRIFPDAVLDAAHNEYLQILLNWGAVGLAAYLGWIVCAAVGAYRNGSKISMSILCGIAGYAVQACVNIAQAPGIMLFFVLLAAAGNSGFDPGGKTGGGAS